MSERTSLWGRLPRLRLCGPLGDMRRLRHEFPPDRHYRIIPTGAVRAGSQHLVIPGYRAVVDVAEVEIRRSPRRRRTVTAFREAGHVVVCLPSRLSKAEERRWVQLMVHRLETQEQRRRPSDDALLTRARELSQKYLDGRAEPVSVRWSTVQRARWGSCTPIDGSIRISERLRGLPTWVIDYVLVHELAHLLVSDHGPDFWAFVGRYPRMERARGFLDGLSHAAGERIDPETEPDDRSEV